MDIMQSFPKCVKFLKDKYINPEHILRLNIEYFPEYDSFVLSYIKHPHHRQVIASNIYFDSLITNSLEKLEKLESEKIIAIIR